MSDHLKAEHYENSEGATLTVHLDDDTTVDLTQVDYTDTSTAQVDGFSAIFEGPLDPAFEQGSYTIEHANAGTGKALLVPVINRASEKRTYELVVSQMKEEVDEASEHRGED